MGMYVLPQRESSLESYLRDWMSRNQQEKMAEEGRKEREAEREARRTETAQERAERQRERAEDRTWRVEDTTKAQTAAETQRQLQEAKARITGIVADLKQLPLATQKDLWPRLSSEVRAAYGIDPTTINQTPEQVRAEKDAAEALRVDIEYKRALTGAAGRQNIPQPPPPRPPDVQHLDEVVLDARAQLDRLYDALAKTTDKKTVQRLTDEVVRVKAERDEALRERTRIRAGTPFPTEPAERSGGLKTRLITGPGGAGGVEAAVRSLGGNRPQGYLPPDPLGLRK